MALVTGNYLTAAGVAIPTGAQPRVEAIPSQAAVTVDDVAISREPITVTPNATTGAFTLNLIPTDTVIAPDFHYDVRGYYLAPTGYGVTGYTRHDVFTFKLYVGADGGPVGENIGGVRIADAWVHVSLTAPAVNRQIPGSYYLNASDDPELGTGNLYRVV